MDRTLKCVHSFVKLSELYFTVVLFVFRFYPVCNLEKIVSFGLGTIKSDRANKTNDPAIRERRDDSEVSL